MKDRADSLRRTRRKRPRCPTVGSGRTRHSPDASQLCGPDFSRRTGIRAHIRQARRYLYAPYIVEPDHPSIAQIALRGRGPGRPSGSNAIKRYRDEFEICREAYRPATLISACRPLARQDRSMRPREWSGSAMRVPRFRFLNACAVMTDEHRGPIPPPDPETREVSRQSEAGSISAAFLRAFSLSDAHVPSREGNACERTLSPNFDRTADVAVTTGRSRSAPRLRGCDACFSGLVSR